MDAKTVFALLFLIAVLFVVGLSLGAMRGDGEVGEPSWVEGLRDLLVLKQPLEVDDLEPTTDSECRQSLRRGVFTLVPGRACTLDVRASSSKLPRTRTLTLCLTQGLLSRATFDPRNEDLLTTKHTLELGAEPVELHVDREGGAIGIACTGGSDCRIEVVTS